jgi:hypothetical protein
LIGRSSQENKKDILEEADEIMGKDYGESGASSL